MKKTIKRLLIGTFVLSIFVMPTFAQHAQHNSENTDTLRQNEAATINRQQRLGF